MEGVGGGGLALLRHKDHTTSTIPNKPFVVCWPDASLMSVATFLLITLGTGGIRC